jgi:DNA-binding XRE family transcriptional regulator
MSFTLCLTFTFITFTVGDMTKLAEHLSASGTTDAALAAKVGCDRSMITKIRAGKATPSLPLALAITRETGVPVEALLPTGAAA